MGLTSPTRLLTDEMRADTLDRLADYLEDGDPADPTRRIYVAQQLRNVAEDQRRPEIVPTLP